ncbi:hypothetical protein KIM372_16300 [Bombiscardovia nodaiensis]|uniref:Uncharacterized protein n=1 Tax=Bombiscardovia nodaiensis TaxID=2932181 RepID=A0ABN6SDQ7_9BIFI|nr:hypothetical protein KIM372_16300 [Bombiscardovia nodaiensis]
MGIDIFLGVADVLVAAALTWFIVWYFLMPQAKPDTDGPSDEPASPEQERTDLAPANDSSAQPATAETSTSSKAQAEPETTETKAAPPESASTRDQQERDKLQDRLSALEDQRRHSGILALIATILTAPVLALDVCNRLAPALLPSWLASPWIQAILVTPVVFYCGRPIFQDGWSKLKAHQTNLSSLVAIASSLAYAYSLAACAIPILLPEGSRQPYFDVIGVITALTLFAQVSEQSTRLNSLAGRIRVNEANADSDPQRTMATRINSIIASAISTNSSAQAQVDALLSKAEPLVMIIAVWTFMIWLLVGPQPRLAHAVANAAGVLIIACPTALAISIPLSFRTALGAGLAHGMLFTSPRSMGHLAATRMVVIDESALGLTGLASRDQATCAELARASTHLRALKVTSVMFDSQEESGAASNSQLSSDPVESAARQAGVDMLFTGVDSERKVQWLQRLRRDLHQIDQQAHGENNASEQDAGCIAFASADETEPQTHQAAQVSIDMSSAAGLLSPTEAAEPAEALRAHRADRSPVPSEADLTSNPEIAHWAHVDLVLQAGNVDGIARAIELARSTKRVINQNLSWAYAYNIVAIALATGIAYPLFGWMMNPMVAPVATAIASLVPIVNTRRLSKHKRLRRRWHALAQAQPEQLPTLAANRPQVITDGGYQFRLNLDQLENPEHFERSGQANEQDGLPDQTRQ